MEFKQVIKEKVKDNVRRIKPPRKYVHQSEQLDYIALWRSSGLSIKDFCFERGITADSFMRWLKQHEEKAPDHNVSCKKKNEQAPDDAVAQAGVARWITLELPGGGTLHLAGAMDHAFIMSLVKEMVPCK